MSMAMSRRRILQLAMAPAFLSRAQAQVQDLDPTVSRVYPGGDGKLVYVPDEQGNTIHDASHAGYRGGGVAIPTVPVRETIWPVVGDNTEHIQAVIDKVSSRPPDTHGFRGAVLLKAGYYRMATPLRIQTSGRCCAEKAWAIPAPFSSALGPAAPVVGPAVAVRPHSLRSPARPA